MRECLGVGNAASSWGWGASFPEAKVPLAPQQEHPESGEMTEEQLLESFHLMAPSREDLPILWNAISTYDSMRAHGVTDIKKWKVSLGGETFTPVT